MSSSRVALVMSSALIASALAAGSLAAAAPAHAAGTARYAAPGGTTAQDCLTPATACNIEKAIGEALNGDQVILAPGAYVTDQTITSTADDLVVRGADPANRPQLTTTASEALSLGGARVTVRDLTLAHSGAGFGLFVDSTDSLVERVSVRTAGVYGCVVTGGLLRDSLCAASGNGAIALLPASLVEGATARVRVRNVTAVASGTDEGYGVAALNYAPGSDFTVDMVNVIASGVSVDVGFYGVETSTTTLDLSASNYLSVLESEWGSVTPAGSGTNQTAEPVFADPDTYHQSASSPTVDAGEADGFVGARDLDGTPRPSGSAPDIGVDEFPGAAPTAPQTVLKKKPAKKTTATKAKFTFTSTTPGSTFRCQLDKKKPKPCTSPYKAKKLEPGKHTFKVWATAGGLTDPTPAKYTWRVKKKR